MEIQFITDTFTAAPLWDDASCASLKPYICELPAGTTTATPSVGTCTVVNGTNGTPRAYCSQAVVYADAEAECASFNGALARIDDLAENDDVVAGAIAQRGSVDNDGWIGGNDRDVEAVWEWADGTVFDDLR